MNPKSMIRLSAILMGFVLSLNFMPLWAQSFTGSIQMSCASGNQIVRDVDVNTNGWTFTAGSGQNTSPTTYDGLLVAHDGNQNLKWYVDFIGAGNDELNGVDVISSGPFSAEVYVTGYFTGSMTLTRHDGFPIHNISTVLATISASGGASDATYFVSKFDLSGNHIWTHIASQAGQNNTDIGNDVSVVQVGATRYVYTTGFWRGNTTFTGSTGSVPVTADASFNDAFVACYIDNGTTTALQWVKTFGVSGKHDYGWGLQANATGDVYVTGSIAGALTATGNGSTSISLGNIGGDDAYLLKYNAAGNILRGIVFGGDAPSVAPASDCGRGIALGAGNRIIVSGYYKGNSAALGNTTNQDAFLIGFIETGSSGFNYNWKDFFRASGPDVLYRIATSGDQEKCYAAGSYTGTLTPSYNGTSASTQNPSNPGTPNGDSFFAVVDAMTGAEAVPVVPIWDDTDFDGLTGAAVLANGTAYFCGNFKGYFYYDAPSASSFYFSNCFPGTYESVLLEWDTPYKRSPNDESTLSNAPDALIGIYPNPSTSIFTISKSSDSPITFKVYDIQGRLLVTQVVTQNDQVQIDLTDHSAGIYILKANDGKTIRNFRLVKQ